MTDSLHLMSGRPIDAPTSAGHAELLRRLSGQSAASTSDCPAPGDAA